MPSDSAEMLTADQIQLKEELLRRIDASLGEFADKKGEVFSSGLNALQPGPLYVMGLNPGGGEKYRSIREHVRQWRWAEFSAFTEQCWNDPCWDIDCYGTQDTLSICPHEKGHEVTQVAQRRVIERALLGVGQPPENIFKVFATNAIFAKSKDSGKEFAKENECSLAAAWSRCKPIHEFLLSKVQPKIIVCLGYAKGGSAYSMAKSLLDDISDEVAFRRPTWTNDNFRWVTGRLAKADSGERVLLVGVRHPSYYRTVADAAEYVDLIARHVTCPVS